MRVKNTSKYFHIEKIREIVKFCKPSGVHNFDIWVKRGSSSFPAGRAYIQGCAMHSRVCPYIVIKINPKIMKFPFYMDARKAYLKQVYYSVDEAFVGIVAHELRHLWQTKHKRGYRVYGSRGQYSERDCDAYAIHKIREWRRK